jgi:hypothetical protein
MVDDAAARAEQRDLVRRGYDAISVAYRGDDGEAARSPAENLSRYEGWHRFIPEGETGHGLIMACAS